MPQNFLNPSEFRFHIKRLPHVSFYTQSVDLPGLTIGKTQYPTPFQNLPMHGDQVEFEDFSVTFRVSENMDNYIEVMNWIIGMGKPKGFEQFKDLKENEGIYSDATLIMMNSTQNPNITVSFKNLFPISLSSISMDAATDNVEYAICTVAFAYESFEFIKTK
jgi:hypothetical protein